MVTKDKLREILDETGDTIKGRFLTFPVGEDTNLKHRRNSQVRPITPEMPDCIKGIINLRGSSIPAMDARIRFKKSKKDYAGRACVIVINLNGTSIGPIVDCVSEVLTIPKMDIPKAQISTPEMTKNIEKRDNQIVLLIDYERLLNVDDPETVSARV